MLLVSAQVPADWTVSPRMLSVFGPSDNGLFGLQRMPQNSPFWRILRHFGLSVRQYLPRDADRRGKQGDEVQGVAWPGVDPRDPDGPWTSAVAP